MKIKNTKIKKLGITMLITLAMLCFALAFSGPTCVLPNANEELLAHRERSVVELRQYAESKGESNFTPANWIRIQGYVIDGMVTISTAKSKDAVDDALEIAKKNINNIPVLIDFSIVAKGPVMRFTNMETRIVKINSLNDWNRGVRVFFMPPSTPHPELTIEINEEFFISNSLIVLHLFTCRYDIIFYETDLSKLDDELTLKLKIGIEAGIRYGGHSIFILAVEKANISEISNLNFDLNILYKCYEQYSMIPPCNVSGCPCLLDSEFGALIDFDDTKTIWDYTNINFEEVFKFDAISISILFRRLTSGKHFPSFEIKHFNHPLIWNFHYFEFWWCDPPSFTDYRQFATLNFILDRRCETAIRTIIELIRHLEALCFVQSASLSWSNDPRPG